MLRHNLQVFLSFLAVVIFLIALKTGHIFDVGIFFRKVLVPTNVTSTLISPTDDDTLSYQKLLAENSRLQALAQENKQLKDLLDFKQAHDYKLLVANLVVRDAVDNNIVTIDAGEPQGIAVGQGVVVADGILVGRVIEVGADYARVRLLTDKFTKLAVKIGADQSVSGLLTGSLGLSMQLDYILQDKEVKKGDLVVTADTDSKIPAGLVIGRIESVSFSKEEVFKKAVVTPLTDYNSLSIVAVVIVL